MSHLAWLAFTPPMTHRQMILSVTGAEVGGTAVAVGGTRVAVGAADTVVGGGGAGVGVGAGAHATSNQSVTPSRSKKKMGQLYMRLSLVVAADFLDVRFISIPPEDRCLNKKR